MNRLPADHVGNAAGKLIRDDLDWSYPGYGETRSRRRLRVWRMTPKAVVAVITEGHDDPGTSITNAPGPIRLELEREYPQDLVLHVEHYPAGSGAEADRWDAVDVDVATGRATWQPLDPDDLAARLPGLRPTAAAPAAPGDPPPDGVPAELWAMTAGLDSAQLAQLARAVANRATQMLQAQQAPVLDANGDPVPADNVVVTDELRAWFAGRVPARDCPHYIAGSEARAGLTTCERCPAPDGSDGSDDDEPDNG